MRFSKIFNLSILFWSFFTPSVEVKDLDSARQNAREAAMGITLNLTIDIVVMTLLVWILVTAPADSPAAFHRVEAVLIVLGVMLFTIAFMLLHSVWESSKYISKEESIRIIRNYFAD